MEASKFPEMKELITNAFRDVVDAAISDASALDWEVIVSQGAPTETPDLSRAAGFRFSFSGASAGEVIVGVDDDLFPRFQFRDLQDDTPDVANLQKSRLLAALQEKRPELEASLSKAGVVTAQVELVDSPALGDHEVMELVCRAKGEEGATAVSLFVCISPNLIADLQQAMAQPFVFPHAKEAAANLDLVMDVELNVTLRFGQRQMALREVLELSSGSVVELDRQVEEPIELILDGKVVARGEAVIIDGNYGMRVTQVLQPLLA